MDINKLNERITVGIPTKDRGLELSLLLYSLLDQTYQDFDIFIINDHSSDFLTQNTTFQSIIKLHKNLGHKTTIIDGDKKGPQYGGQKILENSKTELIFRIDDDVTLRPDCIEKLVKCFEDKEVVAAGPIYLLPFLDISKQIIDLNKTHNYEELGKIYAGYGGVGVNGSLQMNILLNAKKNIPVEHFHSGFMYRKSKLEKIGGYFLGYSKVGHREETDTSYRLHLDNGKLVICPEALAFHFHPFWGGIRTDEHGNKYEDENWENDEKIFVKRFINNFPMDDKYDSVPPSLYDGMSGISAYIPPEEKKLVNVEVSEPLNETQKQLIEKLKPLIKESKIKQSKEHKIHLVTVTHGEHLELKKLIDSVFKFTKNVYSWTIINNDSNIGSHERFTLIMETLRNSFHNYLLTEDHFNKKINYKNLEKEVSVSEARNIGAKLRPDDTDYICFVDDDALILGKWSDDDWFDIMYKQITKERDIGAVSPIYTWFDPLKSYVLSVACLMVPVKVWEQVGGFDIVFGNKEKGTWGYEDTDWSYRLQNFGYKLSRIEHEGFPFYHEDTTFKEKTKWQEEGLLKAKELLLSKYNLKEIQEYNRTIYPFNREQMEITGKKINIGCYHMKLNNFINIDINPDCKPDICEDIRKLIFEENSVSLILASQVVEHFDLVDNKFLFSQFYKWLSPGGYLIIEVPDVGKILDLIEGGEDPKKYEGAIYGNGEVMGMKHKSQFDEKLLTGMLREAGFNNMIKNIKTSENDEITLRFDIRK